MPGQNGSSNDNVSKGTKTPAIDKTRSASPQYNRPIGQDIVSKATNPTDDGGSLPPSSTETGGQNRDYGEREFNKVVKDARLPGSSIRQGFNVKSPDGKLDGGKRSSSDKSQDGFSPDNVQGSARNLVGTGVASRIAADVARSTSNSTPNASRKSADKPIQPVNPIVGKMIDAGGRGIVTPKLLERSRTDTSRQSEGKPSRKLGDADAINAAVARAVAESSKSKTDKPK